LRRSSVGNISAGQAMGEMKESNVLPQLSIDDLYLFFPSTLSLFVEWLVGWFVSETRHFVRGMVQ